MEIEKVDLRQPTEQPNVCQHVIVITPRYRCLGYVDETGVWRNAFSREQIEVVVGWRP
jgi:hypothetical protein